MKFKMLKGTLSVAMMASLLTGCSGSSTIDEADIVDAQELYGCSTLNVYNAGEYIADDTISNFETLYTAKVNYDTFDSNETLYTKLLGGSQYDVLIPSDYMIERMIQEDMLQPVDKDALTNYSNLDSAVLDNVKVFDENLEYAVPYFYGSVGLVYNNTVISDEEIAEQGWDILHNEAYKGRVYAYDSQRDMFMIAFKALGYSMNTEDEDEINAAYEWLLEMNEAVEPAYVTDEVIDGMVNGDMDIAVMYSGDAAYVTSENSEMSYIEPSQGTNVWTDGMVIPSNSACPALANQFINYMLDNDTAQANTEAVGYTSPNSEVRDFEASEDGEYYGIDAYLPRSGYASDEVFRYNEKLTKKLSELYTKVKVSIN